MRLEPEIAETSGPIDYRRGRRVWGPTTYPWPHAGGWIKGHNKRKRPIRRKVRPKRY